jgi:hypothetical protein
MSDSESGTQDQQMKRIDKVEDAMLRGYVDVQKTVDTDFLHNGVANHLAERARGFECMFQLLMGRRGNDVVRQASINKDPVHREKVELSTIVELDGGRGQYMMAMQVAEEIEKMFLAEYHYHTQRDSGDVEPEEINMPDHMKYMSWP